MVSNDDHVQIQGIKRVLSCLISHCTLIILHIANQKRWKKPANTAQTRLENRTIDSKLDKLATELNKLKTILQIYQLMSCRKRGPFVSVQLMSRWKNIVGLNVGVGEFLHKYPHVFEVFTHPVRRNLCCRITRKMRDLIEEEENVAKQCELDFVRKVKKLLMMSKSGTLHVHALRLIRRELGLPEDFSLDRYVNTGTSLFEALTRE